MGYSAGVLAIFYKVAIGSGIAPLVIFMGVGAMTDFGPLLANPRTLLLGAAAQFGIFATVLGALTLNYFGIISFTLPQAAAIGIIGGADGPTAIYLSGKLAPELLGAIAVAAYSYMALVPLIQPPIMKALTTDKERKIRMVQLRTVSKREKSCSRRCCCCWWRCCCRTRAAAGDVLLRQPDARERRGGAPERHGAERADQHRDHLPRAVGGGQAGGGQVPAAADAGDPGAGGDCLLRGHRGGVLMAKLMNLFSHNKINPLIGSAGVSAVPMAARVSNKVGLESDAQNFLLMHAMGPNVAG
jgi:oxaloacetate decarboxylase beta subunit